MPSESTRKSRRRRNLIFVDEPIQWHLRHSRHDRCPWCGLRTMERRSARFRLCTNTACDSGFKNRLSSTEWFKAKMRNQSITMTQYLGPTDPHYRPLDKTDCYALKEAQIRSNTGRGAIEIQHSIGWLIHIVYWHQIGYLPELEDGTRICEGGSKLHKWLSGLRHMEIWTPDESLCAMEVLARAANDEPMFAILAT